MQRAQRGEEFQQTERTGIVLHSFASLLNVNQESLFTSYESSQLGLPALCFFICVCVCIHLGLLTSWDGL